MDATRHGLFRRLRRRTSRAPLGPDPLSPAEANQTAPPMTTVVQSPWLRAAFGLEVEGVSRVIALTDVESVLTPAMSPPAHSGTPALMAEEWPAAEHIVEPVWIWEPEQD